MTDQPAPRRRFQFRLRTLLIAITLFCIACGYVEWQAKIVMDRKAAVSKLLGLGGHIVGAEGLSPSTVVPHRDYSIPLLRRLMGDHPVLWVIYKRGTTSDELHRFRDAFPEAVFDDDSVLPEAR
jgi:hypothetical protein